MINSTTRLRTIVIEYKNILLNDGMVTRDELKEMMSVDEELCTLCNYSEEALDKIGEVILRQANKNKNRRKVILDKSHISKVLEERMRLYIEGLSDVEIAKKQDVCLTTIYAWRETRRLKPNPTISEKISDMRMRYYEQGLTDREIAEKTGVTCSAIAEWRRRRRLPVNKKGDYK